MTRIASFPILVCLLVVFHTGQAEVQQFENMPRSQTVPEGQPVLLECQVNAQEDSLFEYEWTRNGTTIVHRKTVSGASPMDLFIKEFRAAQDAGVYVCTVTDLSTGARLSTPAASLNLMRYISANIQVMEQLRSSVTLFCDVKTTALEPVPSNITWFRNQHEVKDDDRFSVRKYKLNVRTNGQEIDYVEQDKRKKPLGTVRCGAHSSQAGMIFSKPFNLDRLIDRIENHVPEKRHRKRPHQKRSNDSPRRILTLTEDPIVFNCRLGNGGNAGEHLIEWTKDGKSFKTSRDEGPGDGRIGVDSSTGNMHIMRTAIGDDGIYQCQSVDPEDRTIILQKGASYELSVRYKLKFTPTPTSKNLELYQPGKVHCKAQGTPWPDIRWTRDDGAELDTDLMEDFNGTLLFKNVTKAIVGNYTCVAESAEGRITATIGIQVVQSPQFLVAPEGPVVARENDTIVLHCQATGDPLPTIQWDKDLKYLSAYNNTSLDIGGALDRVQVFDNGTLIIREVREEDEGKYGCTIGNFGGLKREEIEFTLKSGEFEDGEEMEEEKEDGSSTIRAFLVTLGLATAYILFVVLLMMWCRYKKRVLQEGDDAEAALTENKEMDPFVTNSTSRDCAVSMNGTVANGGNTTGTGNGSAKKIPQFNAQNFAIDRSCVTDLVVIGRGEFGEVSVGRMTVKDIRAVRSIVEKDTGKLLNASVIINAPLNSTDKDKEVEEKPFANGNGTHGKTNGGAVTAAEGIEVDNTEQQKNADQEDKKQVLVKVLSKATKDESLRESFQKQMQVFGSVHHRNITRLYGVSLTKQPLMMVLEYTDWGDLKQFILATAPKSPSPPKAEGGDSVESGNGSMPPLTVVQTLTLAQQISRGMDALTRAGFVHGDLATRNCVISSVFVAKVSIPSLCRDKYAAEYHRVKDQQRLLPVRWMAPELLCPEGEGDKEGSVVVAEGSVRTDVWSYGVLVWELFNQGVELPFAHIPEDTEFVERVKGGGDGNGLGESLQLPERCPVEVRELVERCWAKEAAERPTFGQLSTSLLARLKEEK